MGPRKRRPEPPRTLDYNGAQRFFPGRRRVLAARRHDSVALFSSSIERTS
jgi:hypothetical protein